MPLKETALICNATSKRSKQQCNNPAVIGSDKCRMHGGTQPKGFASPNFKHGKFSDSLPPHLAETYAQGVEDRELTELRDELSLIDTLLKERLSKLYQGESKDFWNILKFNHRRLLDDFVKCNFLSGNEDFLPDHLEVIEKEDKQAANEYKKAKEGAVETLEIMTEIINRGLETYFVFENIKPFLEQRRRLTESENKRLEKLQNFIPAEKAFAIIAVCAELVNNHVHDPEARRAISKGLLRAANIED